MPATVSNPRDLLLQLLGEVLYVERRLAGGVLRELIGAVTDHELRAGLEAHLEATRTHVDRAERAFRRLDASPSAHLVAAFESSVAEHDEVASSIAAPVLADVFHASTALQTEQLEIALYRGTIALADACGHNDVSELLSESWNEDDTARGELERRVEVLAREAFER